MSSGTSQYVATVVHGQPRGTFKVSAQCDGDQDIRFEIQSLDSRPDIVRTPVDPSLNYMAGQLARFPLTNREVPKDTRQSCAHLRVRLGTGDIKQFVSTECSDNRNIDLTFLGDRCPVVKESVNFVGDLYGSMLPWQIAQAFKQVTAGLPDALTNISTTEFEVFMRGITRQSDVLSTDSMRVELQLAGSNAEVVPSVIVLNLQDPGFRRIASQCAPAPGEVTEANMDAAFQEEVRRQEEARRAAEIAAQIAGLISKGDTEYTKGNYETAIATYGKVLSINQTDDQARNIVLASFQRAQRALARQQAIIRQQANDGEWADRGSGLMWTLKDNGQDINWKKANEYCQTLRSGGFTDWRLASIDELKTLYVGSAPLDRSRSAVSPYPVQSDNPFAGYIPSAPAYRLRGGSRLRRPASGAQRPKMATRT